MNLKARGFCETTYSPVVRFSKLSEIIFELINPDLGYNKLDPNRSTVAVKVTFVETLINYFIFIGQAK